MNYNEKYGNVTKLHWNVLPFIWTVILCHIELLHLFIDTIFKILELSTPFNFPGFIQRVKVVRSQGETHIMDYQMGRYKYFFPLDFLYLHHQPIFIRLKWSLWLLHLNDHSQLIRFNIDINICKFTSTCPYPTTKLKIDLVLPLQQNNSSRVSVWKISDFVWNNVP